MKTWAPSSFLKLSPLLPERLPHQRCAGSLVPSPAFLYARSVQRQSGELFGRFQTGAAVPMSSDTMRDVAGLSERRPTASSKKAQQHASSKKHQRAISEKTKQVRKQRASAKTVQRQPSTHFHAVRPAKLKPLSLRATPETRAMRRRMVSVLRKDMPREQALAILTKLAGAAGRPGPAHGADVGVFAGNLFASAFTTRELTVLATKF